MPKLTHREEWDEQWCEFSTGFAWEANKKVPLVLATPKQIKQYIDKREKALIEAIERKLPDYIKDEVLETGCGASGTREIPSNDGHGAAYCKLDAFNECTSEIKKIINSFKK